MAKDFPYTLVANKLESLLRRVPNIGKPRTANRAWLESLGYRSSNDRSILTVLKDTGITEKGGTPTPLWDALRSQDTAGRRAIAKSIRETYADLFATYPDAPKRDAEALRNFFRANTSAGDRAQSAMVSTFQVLAGFGEFDDGAPTRHDGAGKASDKTAKQDDTDKKDQTEDPRGRSHGSSGLGLTVNIQLQIPATSDSDVYEKLFAAMRKHLIELRT